LSKDSNSGKKSEPISKRTKLRGPVQRDTRVRLLKPQSSVTPRNALATWGLVTKPVMLDLLTLESV